MNTSNLVSLHFELPNTEHFSSQTKMHDDINQSSPVVMQVFDTVEVLVIILYQLPTRDLLFAQKFCKQWKAVIKKSHKLQQALFFRNIHDAPVSASMLLHLDRKLVTNPLLAPLLENTLVDDLPAGHPWLSPTQRHVHYFEAHPSWQLEDASWRKMLPTQPATYGIFDVSTDLSPRAVYNEVEKEDPDEEPLTWFGRYDYCDGWDWWVHPDGRPVHVVTEDAMELGVIVDRIEEMLESVPNGLCTINSCLQEERWSGEMGGEGWSNGPQGKRGQRHWGARSYALG
jgi:hypothetical protein